MGTFSVGKFAKIIGVNAQTLRWYERCGILETKRDENNKYRTYTDLDVRRVLYCRLYRSMGFSLEEIKDYFDSSDLNKVEQGVAEKTAELQRQIDEAVSRKEQLDYYLRQIEEIKKGMGRCWIEGEGESFYRLAGTEKNDLIERREKEALTERLQSSVPWTKMCVRIRAESVGKGKELNFNWGLGIQRSYVAATDLEEELKRQGEYYPAPGAWAVTILHHKGKELSGEDLQPLLDFIREQGCRLDGDITGILLLPEFEQAAMTHYIKCFAPIVPKEQ